MIQWAQHEGLVPGTETIEEHQGQQEHLASNERLSVLVYRIEQCSRAEYAMNDDDDVY